MLIAPFAILLGLIAVMPLMPLRLRHAWEKYYAWVSVVLALVVACAYVRFPGGADAVTHTLHEYVSFIALIGALFIVAGGVHLRVRAGATSGQNVGFLLAGALLANLIGTTGASVVLIRPWIRMNQARIGAHHIVFFIFLVSNIGGSLTPIGDPPLFLGFLRGVPFFWLASQVWQPWAVTTAVLLIVFYFVDRRSGGRAEKQTPTSRTALDDGFRIDGWVNVALLAVVVAAVFLPARFFLREGVMLAAAAISLAVTPKEIHRQNAFSFAPIKEVAFLFLGIFVTMIPALDYLEANGRRLGVTDPVEYFAATGGASAVLDNAPTYVNFLKLAQSTFVEEFPGEHREAGAYDRRAVGVLLAEKPKIVVAISLGAVFFGAMTYIGNGPNFMVKSIAEAAGVRCPSFFGYLVRYSVPILLPIFALVAWLFL
jgi:Na+/H+ antiporter NhaD/arsenite permease-like protein